MQKKYSVEKDEATGLYRITALVDLPGVRKGDLGGLIEGEHNLSHEGTCWVSGQARVSGEARV